MDSTDSQGLFTVSASEDFDGPSSCWHGTCGEGREDQLLGRIQERYGWEKDRARKELDDFFDEKDERQRRRA
jgi:hypothetical protein